MLGAQRVRFVHLGVDHEGRFRAACKPTKTDLQLTTDIEKVTCHVCKSEMEKFFQFMESEKAKGNLPAEPISNRAARRAKGRK